MTTEQQLAIRNACAYLISTFEIKQTGDIQSYVWDDHLNTIKELIKTYPFLNDFKPFLRNLK